MRRGLKVASGLGLAAALATWLRWTQRERALAWRTRNRLRGGGRR